MERRRFIAKWLASKGSLKMGLCSVESFQAASSCLQSEAIWKQISLRHAMAYRPIPHPPCQRTACQQAVRSADKRFRLPNICTRVHTSHSFSGCPIMRTEAAWKYKTVSHHAKRLLNPTTQQQPETHSNQAQPTNPIFRLPHPSNKKSAHQNPKVPMG